METLPMDTGEVQIVQESFSLPAEIWTMILERVGQNNDLLACRQVNRLWYSVATPICRSRFLRPNFSGILKNPTFTSFVSTFTKCNNLPWSACVLDVGTSMFTHSNYRVSFTQSQIHEFIHLFGSHIHELTISGDEIETDEGLLCIMSGIPNIKYLDISGINIYVRIEESFTTQLGRLKGLIAYIHNCSSFHFFQLLLNRPEVQLRSLALTIKPDGWLWENCEVLSTLIAGIPILHLQLIRFLPKLFIRLTRKRVQVRKLYLDVPGVSGIPGFYSSLEEFLKNTADSLQKLALYFNPTPAGERENCRLSIPMLPQLTSLVVTTRTGWKNPILSNVSPFTPDQFPKLAKVSVPGNCTTFGGMSLFDLGGGPFDTVTQLKLSDTDPLRQNEKPLERNWDEIFPNLKELAGMIASSGLLRLSLSKFKSLERLFLSVYNRPCQQFGDGSTILSGGRLFGNETQGDKYPSQLELGESGTASFLSLTHLKEFKLRVYPQQQTICDAFMESFLLKIQPLNNLCLENVIMSKEYKEKLQKYHRKAEIYDGRNPKSYKYSAPFKFHGLL